MEKKKNEAAVLLGKLSAQRSKEQWGEDYSKEMSRRGKLGGKAKHKV